MRGSPCCSTPSEDRWIPSPVMNTAAIDRALGTLGKSFNGKYIRASRYLLLARLICPLAESVGIKHGFHPTASTLDTGGMARREHQQYSFLNERLTIHFIVGTL